MKLTVFWNEACKNKCPLAYDKAYETLLMEGKPVYDYAITGVILGVKPEIDLYIKLIDLKNTEACLVLSQI